MLKQLPTLDEVNKHLAETYLEYFTHYTFPGYNANWHHKVMFEYLDKFVSGEIKRLMIFAPPRHGKSEIVSRRLPAFILGRNPDAEIIMASYGADLARRMNRDVQRIIDHELYQDLFPQTKLYGANVRTVAQGTYLRNSDIFEIVGSDGRYRSTGVGGAITGMGMQYGIIDDPYKNRQDANSQIIRETIWDWYRSTFLTRLQPNGGVLITLTRWHAHDIIFQLLELEKNDPNADQWTIIVFPATAEGDLPPYDPRSPGEPLWPDMFDLEMLKTTKLNIGPYEWSSLYQQNPVPRGGEMFKIEDFKIVARFDRSLIQSSVRYWDKAGTEGGGAYTAGVLMHRLSTGRFVVENVVRGQWSATQRERVIRQTAELDGHDVTVWQEQEPGSGGKESAENTVRNLAGFLVYTERVTGSKEVRAEPYSIQVGNGNVDVLKSDWMRTFVDEHAAFLTGQFKDQVDAAGGAFNKLSLDINVWDDVMAMGETVSSQAAW